jgi:hypothetical protein
MSSERVVGKQEAIRFSAYELRSSQWPRDLMPGAGFLAVRVQVDVAEEFGKRVRA